MRGDRLSILAVGVLAAAGVYRRRSRSEGTLAAMGVTSNAASDILADGAIEAAEISLEPLVAASLNRRAAQVDSRQPSRYRAGGV